jgi:23S rRNA (uridine2552-2'-O)-methyltransferase
MSRTPSSRRWLDRQQRDVYVKRARQEGYRSRAAYKLAEIDARDHLLRPGLVVVDLGAAPGGWSQYAARRLAGSGRLIALDKLPIEPIPGVECLQGDFSEPAVLDLLKAKLAGQAVDLVMSDMAPNISGIGPVDQARAIGLAELVLQFAAEILRPGGKLLLKTFQGEGFSELRAAMAGRFERIAARKPRASRTESREVYLLGLGFKG